jgi:hypothetical protein
MLGTAVSFRLAANIVVEAQKAFVSQIFKRHDPPAPFPNPDHSAGRERAKAAREGLAANEKAARRRLINGLQSVPKKAVACFRTPAGVAR